MISEVPSPSTAFLRGLCTKLHCSRIESCPNLAKINVWCIQDKDPELWTNSHRSTQQLTSHLENLNPGQELQPLKPGSPSPTLDLYVTCMLADWRCIFTFAAGLLGNPETPLSEAHHARLRHPHPRLVPQGLCKSSGSVTTPGGGIIAGQLLWVTLQSQCLVPAPPQGTQVRQGPVQNSEDPLCHLRQDAGVPSAEQVSVTACTCFVHATQRGLFNPESRMGISCRVAYVAMHARRQVKMK